MAWMEASVIHEDWKVIMILGVSFWWIMVVDYWSLAADSCFLDCSAWRQGVTWKFPSLHFLVVTVTVPEL
jgi:hypothetical protein